MLLARVTAPCQGSERPEEALLEWEDVVQDPSWLWGRFLGMGAPFWDRTWAAGVGSPLSPGRHCREELDVSWSLCFFQTCG